MMNANQKMTPGDLEALLPWHATGSLNGRDAVEVEQALASDQELARRFALVREEMTETILLNEALGAPSARAMENLFKAIDKERKTARSSAGAGGIAAWFADLFTPRVLAFSASAAAVVVLLQAGVIARMVIDERAVASADVPVGSGPYEPQSIGTTRSFEVATYALVRFTPTATIQDIGRFLDSHTATIVDGPRPGGTGGMYRVKVANMPLTSEEFDELMKTYQGAKDVISFAVPTQ